MVTRRIAELLLDLAARRWPTDVRDDLRREWAAELHVLAQSGRWTKMVGFAMSLAVSRAGAPLLDRSMMHRRARRTAAALLLAPLACAGIVVASALAMSQVYNVLSMRVSWSTAAQLPLWSTLTVGFAVLLAKYTSRSARHTALKGPLRVALGVVLPVGVAALGLMSVINGNVFGSFVPGVLLWLAGLTLALWAAASLAARGRVGVAWLVGLVGALVAADLAVILFVLQTIPGPGAGPVDPMTPDSVDRISAPLWLFACWTDWNFGLPRPTSWEIFLITDQLLLEPMFYLACTPYALAYTIRAARSAPAETVALAPTPA
ncbi:hypothetical protein ONO23_00124 [Micromonospora noduli]|uniref:hypothetical protein n=1 Tax=Micromonospora noduli TaxID=709876 RepID=UPI000DBFE6A8|nr:hypothetical protein [Micromonospora noduli]RAO41169.1 hypothetical protein ONO23_00124 [Micromonospora noduli]